MREVIPVAGWLRPPVRPSLFPIIRVGWSMGRIVRVDVMWPGNAGSRVPGDGFDLGSNELHFDRTGGRGVKVSQPRCVKRMNVVVTLGKEMRGMDSPCKNDPYCIVTRYRRRVRQSSP